MLPENPMAEAKASVHRNACLTALAEAIWADLYGEQPKVELVIVDYYLVDKGATVITLTARIGRQVTRDSCLIADVDYRLAGVSLVPWAVTIVVTECHRKLWHWLECVTIPEVQEREL